MSLIVVTLGAVSAGLVTAGLAALVNPPRRRLARRVRPYTMGSRAALGHQVDPIDDRAWSMVRDRGLGALVAVVGRRVGRVARGHDDEDLTRRLRHAQLEFTPDEYRTRLVLSAVTFGTAGAAFGAVVARSPAIAFVLALCGAVFGVGRWKGRIDRAIVERRERTRLELYTVNHLLAMNVRAGAGPVQAVQRVVERGTSIVVDELRAALVWMQRGVSEADAFRRAAALTPEPSAARTYRLFATSVECGSDLGTALRSFSEDLRDARREELRRLATKRRATMLIPIIAVLAPVMLLFIAAPIPTMLFGDG